MRIENEWRKEEKKQHLYVSFYNPTPDDSIVSEPTSTTISLMWMNRKKEKKENTSNANEVLNIKSVWIYFK